MSTSYSRNSSTLSVRWVERSGDADGDDVLALHSQIGRKVYEIGVTRHDNEDFDVWKCVGIVDCVNRELDVGAVLENLENLCSPPIRDGM